MVSFLESSGLVGLSSRLVMVLKSSTGCVSMVDNQKSHLWHTFGAKIPFAQKLVLKVR